MLSPLDDYPIHQVAEPIRQVGTSDRNFYDRYYFNCLPTNGGPGGEDVFLIMGMGQYPNLGVADAFAVVVHEGVHRVVRASRALGLDRMDTSVGPFSVSVLEGLEQLRFRLDDATTSDTGDATSLSFDLTWRGAQFPIEEPRHVDRDAVGRIFLDACRLAQMGSWTGSLRIGDREWEVTPDAWWGSRDRSWGIRPSGEPEPPGITATLPFAGFNWLYAPVRFEDQSVFVICQTRNDGSRVLEEAVRVWRNGTGEGIEHLGRPEYDLTWDDDKRFVVAAQVRAGKLEMDVEPWRPIHLGTGTGYGFDPEWKHGRFVGEQVVQERLWDLGDPEQVASMFGIVDAAARYTLDGQPGHGLFEYMFL